MTDSAPDPAPIQTLVFDIGDPADDTRVKGQVVIGIGGKPLGLDLTVPDGPVAYETLLPVLHGVTNAVVADGVADVERAGQTISCAAGCGACCRQMVPLAESEIRAIVRLVEAMPEPRRSVVRARFDAAMARIQSSPVVDLLDKGDRRPGDVFELILEYFRLGIPCPFLEDESCSIHPVRPTVCREYLVTSPPSECAKLNPEGIRRVPMAGSVTTALLRAAADTDETSAWIPMIAAFHFTSHRAEMPPTRTAPEQLAAVFRNLAATSQPLVVEVPD